MIATLPISIITACRNCEDFIGNTVSSVVEQHYGNLQYIIVDGASTDSTLAVIRNCSDNINAIISEPDAGQYHGIQKGAALARGEVMAWLNGDDVYYSWTFSVVNDIFQKFPEVEWIIGQPSYMNSVGQCIKISGNAGTAYPKNYVKNGWFRSSLAGYLQQESMFWRKSLWDKVGGLNLKYKYAADFELWTRFAEHTDLYSVSVPLALFRKRPGEQKSSIGKDKYENEVAEICKTLKSPPLIWKTLANRGLKWEHLFRFLIWKRCKVVTYSEKESDWVIKEATRPLSRASFAEALLELRVR